MLPAIQGRPCCSSQNPNSIIASRTRLGCPRSNMSNTNVTVTKPGSANSHGPGIRPDPVIALENCALIHQATALNSERQIESGILRNQLGIASSTADSGG